MITYQTYVLPPDLPREGTYRVLINGEPEGAKVLAVKFNPRTQQLVLHTLIPDKPIDFRTQKDVPVTANAACVYVELRWRGEELRHLDACDFVDVLSINGYDVAVFASVRA